MNPMAVREPRRQFESRAPGWIGVRVLLAAAVLVSASSCSSEVTSGATTTTAGRVLGTHRVTLWELDEPFDALAFAAESEDPVNRFRIELREACLTERSAPPWIPAAFASVVASLYSGVESDEPVAQQFIEQHGFEVDSDMRLLALKAITCARDELGGDDTYFGDNVGEFQAEMDVVEGLLKGPRG